MSGKPSRDKGGRGERELVNALRGIGYAAERVPLSGAAGGSFVGDVLTNWCGVDRVFEVKRRKNGFREDYKWLEDSDAVYKRADNMPGLVTVRACSFFALLTVIRNQKQVLDQLAAQSEAAE